MSEGKEVEPSIKRRKAGPLLVYVVEDHNDALDHIYRAIGSKRLPFKGAAMVHFDSHPDLLLPEDFDADRIRDKEYVLNTVSIATWILPAMFAGHITTVAWIKPPWADQMEDGICKCKIGRHVDTGNIKLSCPEPYFVSELLYASEEEIVNGEDITLIVQGLENNTLSTESQFSAQDKVCSLVENDEGIANGKTVKCDALHTSLDKEHNYLEKIPLSEMQFILDIDLDFFSTQNPFHLIFSDFQFQTLHELYKWKRPKWNNANEVKDAAKERQEQLDMLKHILIEEFEGNHCSVASSSRPENCYHPLDNKDKITAKRRELVHNLVEDLKKTANPDIPLNWKFLHDAGCTFDWSGLPHHVSEIREIENLVEKTERLLRSLPKPALVTIARSSYDEYCPKDKVDVIQQLVLVMLERLYGPIDTILDYEPEEDVCSEVNLAGSSSQISYVKKATCENLK